MPKFAEKLRVLNRVADEILQRLAKAKRLCVYPFLQDKAIAHSIRKFPAIDSAKPPGFEGISKQLEIAREHIEESFLTLVDAIEFTKTGINVVNEVGGAIATFNLALNTSITVNWLTAITSILKAHLMLTAFANRKALVGAYAVLFRDEPTALQVANFLSEYDVPLKKLQTDFAPVTLKLTVALTNLKDHCFRLLNTDQMRNEGSLSITQNPAEMSIPPPQYTNYQTKYLGDIISWIGLGFLLTPESLFQEEPATLLSLVLQQGVLFPLYQTEAINLHAEYAAVETNYKSPFKHNKDEVKRRKAISELHATALASAFKARADRRTYLRLELQNLSRLMQDSPALVGPKFETALAAMSLARDEIVWYFIHLSHASSLKKPVAPEVNDDKIWDLIHFLDLMASVVGRYIPVAQEYYIKYLSGPDAHKLEALVSDLLQNKPVEANVSSTLQETIALLQSLTVEALEQQTLPDFEALRVNWERIEALISDTAASTGPIANVTELIVRGNLIHQHTQVVDSIMSLLHRFASLKDLYFAKEAAIEAYSVAIKASRRVPVISAGVRIAASFINAVNQYNAEQLDEIGNEAVKFAHRCLQEGVSTASELITSIMASRLEFEAQTDPSLAFNAITKAPEQVPMPGTESVGKNRDQLAPLHTRVVQLVQILQSIQSLEGMRVFNREFSSFAYVNAMLAQQFKTFLEREISIESGTIQRPTVFERRVQVFSSFLLSLEDYISIDANHIITSALLSMTQRAYFETPDLLAWAEGIASDESADSSKAGQLKVIDMIADFYTYFVEWRLPLGAALYSPSKRCFVSQAAFNAEQYCSIGELTALARVVGANGIRIIDRKVLKVIVSFVTDMKEVLSSNEEVLERLTSSYKSEAECNSCLASLSGVDSFFSKAVALGAALQFRALMYEGLGRATQQLTPLVYNNVYAFTQQYPPNFAFDPAFKTMDGLALATGQFEGPFDPALRAAFSTLSNDSVWDLAPFMFASGFTHTLWTEAVYRPAWEACSNNAHVIGAAIHAIAVLMKAGEAEDSSDPLTLLQHFVEVSSVVLLRIAKQPPKSRSVKYNSLPSAIGFLDNFVQSSPLLSRDNLEQLIPYTLLRAVYRDMYDESDATREG